MYENKNTGPNSFGSGVTENVLQPTNFLIMQYNKFYTIFNGDFQKVI